MKAIVKVGWIGNGEHIERVGFYAQQRADERGEHGRCPYVPYVRDGWSVIDPVASDYEQLAYGEYLFQLPILTGTVVSNCGGFEYVTQGTFFVQTDKNTYWLNPGLDSSRLFYFDYNGYRIVGSQTGWAGSSTDRPDLAYYNPLQCR
jgi:hypothetical protein